MKDKKKKKLTLSVSGPIKKPQQKIELAKVQNRSSIIIEKKGGRFTIGPLTKKNLQICLK